MKKDIRISVIRIMAMFSIVLCHIVQEYSKISFMGQIFNVGVFIFIFMSGFLYGKKEIVSTKNWLLYRAIRLFIPVYIYMIILMIINGLADGKLILKTYIPYLFGVQGFFQAVPGAAHLWFITAIIVCYLITPILCRLKKYVVKFSKMQLGLAVVLLISSQVIVSYSTDSFIGRYVFYVMLYVFAYFISYLDDFNIGMKAFSGITAITVLGLCIRLLSREYVDGSILYSNIIVLYTQSLLGIWLFLSIYRLSNIKSPFYKIIDVLDNISFEVYIVHYVFIAGRYSMINVTHYVIANLAIVSGITMISGLFLHIISGSLTSRLRKVTTKADKVLDA